MALIAVIGGSAAFAALATRHVEGKHTLVSLDAGSGAKLDQKSFLPPDEQHLHGGASNLPAPGELDDLGQIPKSGL